MPWTAGFHASGRSSQPSRLARVRAEIRGLRARAAQLERLRRSAVAAVSAIVATRAQQAGYVARLRTKKHLTAARVASLESAARAAQAKAATVVPAAAPSAAAPGAHSLTVVSTGYSLAGTTATGLPVGWGVVAVDPSVIPLGTRMTIPGYGEGVAADVGSGVAGAMIDLWFPSAGEAQAWGRRAVTVTLH